MGKHLTLDQRIAIQIGLERNHEYIRLVLPKGISFEDLTEADVDKVMSHVNSYARPKMGDARPVDEFDRRFGERTRLAPGIRKIDASETMLRPGLPKRP